MRRPLAPVLLMLLAAQASAADFHSATAHLKAQQHPNSRRGINFSFQKLRLRETHLALELRWGFNLPEGELASGVLEGKYVLNEVDGVAGTQRRYHYGGNAALGISDAQGSRFLNLDALGSPTQETSASTGAVSKVRQTDAWGRYRNGTAPGAADAKYGFTGHQFDVESGYVYMRARYYDPDQARFLSMDLYPGQSMDAPSLHAYAYAHFNPLRYTDPTGECVYQSCAELWEELTGPEKTGAPQAAQPLPQSAKVVQQAKPREFVAMESSGEQKLTSAEKMAKGILPTPSTFKGYYELIREEEERKRETQIRGTVLVAGMAVMAVAPEAAPLLVETAGVSATAAATSVAVAGTASGAAQEYGLTGKVTPEGLVTSAALSSLAAAHSLQDLAALQSTAEATQAARTEGYAALARAEAASATPWGVRNVGTGKWLGGARSGVDPVEDFIEAAKANGYEVVGREITVSTPFEQRRVDVVLRNTQTGQVGGVEIKSSAAEFAKFKPEQAAADRYINRFGAPAVGKNAEKAGIDQVDYTLKIQWPPP